MKRSLWWPTIISASALLSVVVTLSGGALRPVVVSWFLLICPGMAMVRLLHIEDFVIELTLAVAFSIAISTVVAEMMLARIWSSEGGLLVLVSVSMLGAALQIIDAKRRAVDVERTE